MKYKSIEEFRNYVSERNPGQPEYMQAVTEVIESLWPFITSNLRYAEHGLLDRIVEPERIIIFRVAWVDDSGEVKVNRGYRIQHNSAIGPYKGGIRFHPSVNLSILKFLAFEQTFKNALTTLPMGGGKGGSDFDPKGRSPNEIMRFCQAFVSELFRHIGADTDVPAGDIGVGGREVGYMAGMVKKLTNRSDCVFTGKGISFGGSLIRPEATGYGTVYFVDEMLRHVGQSLDGLRVAVSGSGNVAQYAIEKAMAFGAKVVTVSDSSGTVIDEAGFTPEKLAMLSEVKNRLYGRVSDYAERIGAKFIPGEKPWHAPVDVALPCATQNEISEDDAAFLIKNGVICVAEGANMPCTAGAVKRFEHAKVLFAPGKASNAGGVATSGLEMSQQAMRLFWTHEEVDARLQEIMRAIHQACLQYGEQEDGRINYVDGANVAGFVKVADAMLAQGVI
ncbi:MULTISPECIES: NADP-specific glutamate dehydrogenase [unclassified Nitrosomonas]|jgi:glutamate dehydrogenase (NADP+)|uniref:NADP-specific glutamate dehydrogenase n=1 Tax=unclassified Nitrosomonas TaxID=2609265 RepID=UPI0008822CBE|nr:MULTISPECIES: NADP-specific glutamate dehydrogenase [unclassified Nitrosomonas]SDH67304.1 glutamate dehydrogenase (NADP+) [Nitrosomonas sp. Nm132]SDY31930.1 glutamate dehydrogenase (NADP+) [Nitrosomonas sp. Nm58]